MAIVSTTTLASFISERIGPARDAVIAQHLWFPRAPLNGWLEMANLVGSQAETHSFPLYGTLTSQALTQGIDLASSQQLTATDSTATTGEHGLMALIADKVLRVIQTPNGEADYVQAVLRNSLGAVATEFDVAVFALLASLDNSVGTTNVDLTFAALKAGVDYMAGANAPRPWIGLLHPTQYKNLTDETGSPFLSAMQAQVQAQQFYSDYYIGRVLGVDWFYNTNVQTMNAGVDYAGGIISNRAFGQVWSLAPDSRLQRDESLRGAEHIMVAEWAVTEIEGTMGVCVLSNVS